MGSKKTIHIQKIIFDYFLDFDDKTVVRFVEIFMYNKKTNDKRINDLLEKFLVDQGVKDSYERYQYDLHDNDSYFCKCEMSDTQIINDIQHALLNVSFNRLRNLVDRVTVSEVKETKVVKTRKPRLIKLVEPPKVKMTYKDDGEVTVHIFADNGNDGYTLCGNRIEGDFADSELNVHDELTCDHCKSLLKQIKKYK
jgi:hypothetical protein